MARSAAIFPALVVRWICSFDLSRADEWLLQAHGRGHRALVGLGNPGRLRDVGMSKYVSELASCNRWSALRFVKLLDPFTECR